MAQYLLNRNGTFYYQRRIPSPILRKFPSISPVLRISLGAGRISEAKTISHQLSKMFDDFAKIYFKTPEEYTEALMMVQKFEWWMCSSSLETIYISNFFEKYGKEAAQMIGKCKRVIASRRSEILPQAQLQPLQSKDLFKE